MKLIAVLFAATQMFAADAAKVWSTQDIAKRLSNAKPEAHQITGTSLEAYGSYRLSVSKREASGIPELHRKTDDVFVIESGEATLITGGTITGSKTTAPNEVRGQGIEGGTRRKVSTGDFVHIPANTPHQMLLDAGKQITYAVVKVDAR